ncbi:putative quinate permease protein [Seiridium cardinale]|uniref:Quinate permease protein n=1 Tax=Seiridium cardinale TaxID=138064 RepID=A0ABR2XRD2_9PEZI
MSEQDKPTRCDQSGAQSPLPQLDSFHLFPCLPAELRLKIWRESWVSRNVAVRRDDHGLDAESCERFTPQVFYGPYSHETTMHIHYAQQVLYPVNGNDEYYSLVKTTTWTSTPPPVTLFVNHEARTETLLHYELSFGLPGGETRVYFNFGLDALHLSKTGNLRKMLQLKDLKRIRELHIPEIRPALGYYTYCWCREADEFQGVANYWELEDEVDDILSMQLDHALPNLRILYLTNYWNQTTPFTQYKGRIIANFGLEKQSYLLMIPDYTDSLGDPLRNANGSLDDRRRAGALAREEDFEDPTIRLSCLRLEYDYVDVLPGAQPEPVEVLEVFQHGFVSGDVALGVYETFQTNLSSTLNLYFLTKDLGERNVYYEL